MRRRIVLFAMGTALFAVLLLAVPLGIIAARGYVRDERLELQQTAATVAARARGDVLISARPPRLGDGEIAVSVYAPGGRRVSGSGPARGSALVRSALAGRAATSTGGDSIAVAAPVSDGDQVVAAVLLTISLDAAHRRAAYAWLALAGMGLGAVLLSGAGAAVLARRLTRPLDRLTALATRLGAGDRTAPAPPSGLVEIDVLGAALHDSAVRITDTIARERAFSTEVSHQLRTPLAALRLELEAHDSRTALLAVDRLEATIGDVIRLARDLPTSEQVEVDVLLEVIERWRGPLAVLTRPLRITTDVATPLPLSRAAATQIVDVLLDNAVRHGRGAVSVHLRPGSEGTVVLEVADEGPALTVEAFTLFAHRTADGAHGIGLPYARRLAEAEQARLVLRRDDPPTFALITCAATP